LNLQCLKDVGIDRIVRNEAPLDDARVSFHQEMHDQPRADKGHAPHHHSLCNLLRASELAGPVQSGGRGKVGYQPRDGYAEGHSGNKVDHRDPPKRRGSDTAGTGACRRGPPTPAVLS
jgi:hypothetical protein